MGIWLAVTGATPTNHEHVADRRPDANLGYTEIVDVDFSGAERVLTDAGDLLVFDGHLMHCSSDNVSVGRRATMVYQYARAGTVDHTYARLREQRTRWGDARRCQGRGRGRRRGVAVHLDGSAARRQSHRCDVTSVA